MDMTTQLANASTEDLITFYAQVDSKVLVALDQANQTPSQRLRASHQQNADAYIQQLDMIYRELWSRAENFDPLANDFVGEVNSVVSVYGTAG